MPKSRTNKVAKNSKESIKLGALVGLLLGGSMTYRGLITAAIMPPGSFSFIMIVAAGSFVGLIVGVIIGGLTD
jgi:uncharacterized membrane protein